MRQKSGRTKEPAEKVVKDICRATRRRFSAEEKIRIVLEACAARTASPSCAAARVSPRVSITAGPRSSCLDAWTLNQFPWQSAFRGGGQWFASLFLFLEDAEFQRVWRTRCQEHFEELAS